MEVLPLPVKEIESEKCHTFWGGHGCDLERGHNTELHICWDHENSEPCSMVMEIKHPAYKGWIEDGWNDPTKGRWGITDTGYVVGIFG